MNIDKEIEKKAEELFLLLQKKAIYGLNSLNVGDEVYCSDLYKRTVISNPGRLDYIDPLSVFIEIEVEYKKGKKTKEYLSFNDRNIINGGYNLNRLFKNRNDASLYKELLKIFCYKIEPTKQVIVSKEEIEKLPFF